MKRRSKTINGIAEILSALSYIEASADIKLEEVSDALGLLGLMLHVTAEGIKEEEDAAEKK